MGSCYSNEIIEPALVGQREEIAVVFDDAQSNPTTVFLEELAAVCDGPLSMWKVLDVSEEVQEKIFVAQKKALDLLLKREFY